jgi:hypothetical protein
MTNADSISESDIPEVMELNYIVPCEGMMDGPFHMVLAMDEDGSSYYFAWHLHPWNPRLAEHWVYSAQVGDFHSFADPDVPGRTDFEYLGVFRVLSKSELSKQSYWVESVTGVN